MLTRGRTMYVPTQFFLAKIMAQLTAHALAGPFSGALDGVFLGLWVGPVVPLDQNTTLANLTEASFSGYAREALVWHPTYVDFPNNQTVQSASMYFQPTDATVTQTIQGAFIADALAGGNLLLVESFGQAVIPLTGPQTAFSLAAVVQLQGGQNFGQSTIIQ